MKRTVTISNKKGLHARAAAKFVKIAEGVCANVTVARADTPEQTVLATSILGLMMLAAEPGTELILEADDMPQNEACLEALIDLVERRFDEDA